MSPSGGLGVSSSQGECGARGVFREENIAGKVYRAFFLCMVVFFLFSRATVWEPLLDFCFFLICVCFP